MSANLPADAKGIYVIAATPFHDDGRIDFDSIDRLVDFYLNCGVHGMTVLGVMGEFQKLSESETVEVARRFIAAAKGRIPTIVGVSNPGTAQLTRIARTSMEAGAAGGMNMNNQGPRTDEAVLGYMRGVL
jgi:4-hydroxy-tetrahydrodipicolinate synthase